jgi:hypothetical protein
LGDRPAASGVITKDFYTYAIKILRQEKSFAIMTARRYANVIGVHRDKGGMRPLASCCATPRQAWNRH